MTERHIDFRVISLGAGVQSTALLLMAEHGEFDVKPDAAIFADTQDEEPATYEHLDWLERTVKTIPIYRVTVGHLGADVLASVREGKRVANPPFYTPSVNKDTGRVEAAPLRRSCTKEYKIEAIHKAIRELLGYKPRQRVRHTVEQWIGISLDEVHRMRDSSNAWTVNRYPLIERRMTRWDCQLWLMRNGYPIPPKSSCYFCPYHSDAYWREMRDKRPEVWQKAVEFDRAIRQGLRGARGEFYLHRSLKPLDEVDLDADVVEGQMELFGEECFGMCGV